MLLPLTASSFYETFALPSFTKKILGALGVKSSSRKSKPVPKPAGGPKVPERLALIQNAMEIYRQNAPIMRGRVEAALSELKDKTPHFNDVDSVTRLLAIHRANLDIRKLMNHRDMRYVVLVGLRYLLEQKQNPAPPGVKKIALRR